MEHSAGASDLPNMRPPRLLRYAALSLALILCGSARAPGDSATQISAPWPTGPLGDGTLRIELRSPFRVARSFKRTPDGALRILVSTAATEITRTLPGPTLFDRYCDWSIHSVERAAGATPRCLIEVTPLLPGTRADVIFLDQRIRVDLFPEVLPMRDLLLHPPAEPRIAEPVAPLTPVIATASPTPQDAAPLSTEAAPAAADSVLFDAGLQQRRIQAYDLATYKLSLLLERHPRSRYATAAIVEIAGVFAELRAHKRAGLALEKALTRTTSLDPDSIPRPDLLWASATEHLRAERPFRAYERTAALLAKHPGHAAFLDAADTMARAALALNQPEKAREALRQGLKLATDPRSIYQLRRTGATIEAAFDNYPAAIAHLNRAVALLPAPPPPELWLERADLHFRAAHFDSAATDYERVLASLEEGSATVDRDWAQFQVANCRLRTFDLTAADMAYREYLRNQPRGRWRSRAEWRAQLCAWLTASAAEVQRITGVAPPWQAEQQS